MKPLMLLLAAAALTTGCGSSSRGGVGVTTAAVASPTRTATTATRGVSTRPSSAVRLRRAKTARAAIRSALTANHRLVTEVLWTNRIPAGARRSTRGPALAALIASAKDRSRRHLRVRMIRDDYRVISIQVGAMKASGTAVAEWNQRVVPSHPDGTPIGRAVSLRERARIELRRLDASMSFVVWKVTLLK